jgi:hypothetical protein
MKDWEKMLDEAETCDEAEEAIKLVDINNPNEYAKVLLKLETFCWKCDPILIEEWWTDEVHKFLKNLANERR